MSRQSKNKVEERLQDALNEHLPEIIKPSAVEDESKIFSSPPDEFIEIVNQESLRPKVGSQPPIYQTLL